MASKKKVAARRPNSKVKQSPDVTVKVVMNSHDGTPTYYINHAEVHHSPHEFGLAVGRTPGKLPPDRLEEVRTAGQLELNADVLLLFPPTMLPGLIAALIAQREVYEKRFGNIVAQEIEK